MSQVIPGGRDQMLQFYADHIQQWTDNAEAIGLTALQVTALDAAVKNAQEQITTARQLRQNAKAALDLGNSMAGVARSLGGAAMSMIRGYAEQNGDVIYDKAGIPSPKPPTPAGPPSPADGLMADPRADGTILLKWKGTVAQNASFDIERSLDGGQYVFIRNTRDKSWLDEAVPSNHTFITYRIYGVRDNKRSTPATATVLFGNLPPALQAAFLSATSNAKAA